MAGPGWACVLLLSPPTALSTVGVWTRDPGTVVPTLIVAPDLAIFLSQLPSKPSQGPYCRTHPSPLHTPVGTPSQTPEQPNRTCGSPGLHTAPIMGLSPVSPRHRTCWTPVPAPLGPIEPLVQLGSQPLSPTSATASIIDSVPGPCHTCLSHSP